MKAKTRTSKPQYKPLVKLPPLPPDQYEALRQNVAVNGVLVPILVDGDGPRRRIIDGNHRKDFAGERGYAFPLVFLAILFSTSGSFSRTPKASPSSP